jgi:hypothetical protein
LVYASVSSQQIPALLPFLAAQSEARLAQSFGTAQQLLHDPEIEAGAAWYEARNLLSQTWQREKASLHSMVEFTGGASGADAGASEALGEQTAVFQRWLDEQAKIRGAKGMAPSAPWAGASEAKRIPVRVDAFGPLIYQNDNVLLARLGKERYAKIKLINRDANPLVKVRDQSELYAYEIVNFVNGGRSAGEIRDAVSAEYGPLRLSLVIDYLNACAEAGVIEWK